MFRVWLMMWKNPRAAEKSAQHNIPSRRIRRARRQQIRRNNPQQISQLKYIPPLPPKNRHGGSFSRQRIALPRNRFNQRGFSASIRPQDAHMLARFNPQRHVFQRRAFSAHHRHSIQLNQRRSHKLDLILQRNRTRKTRPALLSKLAKKKSALSGALTSHLNRLWLNLNFL